MALPSDKLAESLALLKALQDEGHTAIRANAFSRTHRERLLKNGFIREVMRGWYVASRPDEAPGESTAWYAAFWGFCAEYLSERFGTDWCLNPQQSLSLHTGDWTVPKQLLVRSPKGGNKPTAMPYGTSMFDLRLAVPQVEDIELKEGLRVFSLPAALLHCSAPQYAAHPVEMRAALAMVQDASEVLSRLLAGGHSKIAGRLAGAFRNIGRTRIADDIGATMISAGYAVPENDPFMDTQPIHFKQRETSPYINRLKMNWALMRDDVVKHFPPAPGIPKSAASYLKHIEGVYVTDAYNSLSIEGYLVSEDLIERVRSGNWNPDSIKDDKNHRDALAARGYWQSFQSVKQSIDHVLKKQNAGSVAERDHAVWYRELFGPSVTAGIIKPSDLAGYRNGPVYIRRSKHSPPRPEAVRDLMPTFFELLQNENEPAVRIVLGHFIFVWIHPYFDGNGRMGRFLMNVMLASGGYPWTIVPLDQRSGYMSALESASVEQDIKPFTKFLAGLLDQKTKP
jgi:Fic/DOC family